MKIDTDNFKRNLDIELTNRCNAQCSFCPRDQTPEQGFITFDTFKKAVERAMELKTRPKIHSAGQGEPTLHPQLGEFAEYLQGLGVEFSFTTNGALLTEELAERVLNAGVREIVFSISDLGDDYEEVYALNFDNTRANIFRFLDMNEARGKPTLTKVSLVQHDLNRDKLADYEAYWTKAGIDKCINFDQVNRGGACQNGAYFVDNDRFAEEARAIIEQKKISHVCGAPFGLLFVGWNGQYYLCCQDYRKLTPLGSVFDYSIEEMDMIKRAKFFESKAPEACRNCDQDVTNRLREVLFEIEAGDSPESKIKEVCRDVRRNQRRMPEIFLREEA